MGQLKSKPNSFREGSSQVSAQALNLLNRAIPRQIRGGDDVQVSDYGDRTIVKAKQPRITPDITNQIDQFIIRGEFDDFLEVTPLTMAIVGAGNPGAGLPIEPTYSKDNGSDQTTLFYVAKPYWLQRFPWDGQSISNNGNTISFAYDQGVGFRTVNGGPVPVVYCISPQYIVGDILLCVRCVAGQLGPDGNPVAWMDLNTAARQWLPKTLVTDVVCSPNLVVTEVNN